MSSNNDNKQRPAKGMRHVYHTFLGNSQRSSKIMTKTLRKTTKQEKVHVK